MIDSADLWDGTVPIADAARRLGEDTSWSLFVCADPAFVAVILGAFYGSRDGRGPFPEARYLLLGEDELASTKATLVHTPHNYTFRWPNDVAEAHYDLTPMNAEAARALLTASVDLSSRVLRMQRIDLLTAQVALLRRAGVADRFRENVGRRLRKLAKNEPSLYSQLVVECTTQGISPPTERDFVAA